MNACIRQYKRQLKRALMCCGAVKKRLLAQFLTLLSGFREENPDPDQRALHTAFGSPEDMARVLMDTVTPEEKAQYRRQVRWLRVVAAVLAALFLLFTAYIYIMKEIPVKVEISSHLETDE